jgi:hypothetical protein
MTVQRDDDEERIARSEELLRKLRHQADVAQEERHAEHSAEAKAKGKQTTARAVKVHSKSKKRIRRKAR